MFSTLNNLLPTLKSRLLTAITLAFIILSGITWAITYFSMSRALEARMLNQLENRFHLLEEEYLEELDDEEDDAKAFREAVSELNEKLEEIDAVLKNNNDWVYLVNDQNKVITSSDNAPDYTELKIGIDSSTNKSLFDDTEFIYDTFELPDSYHLVLTADLQEKNEYLALYRNRFLTVSASIILLSILLCYFIIKSSLKGFEDVRKAADSISCGDYSHRVNTTQNEPQEVKDLSHSFNNMIERTEALLKEIKEVSNNVAHDLRTPLTRIRGKVETTLLASADLKEHQELSGIVIEECDKLMLLIDNMLTLAEYESGLVERKQEKIDLKDILKNLCDVFESVCEDKNLEIKLNLCKEVMVISGDKEKIQRSLSNLFDNAIKYSKEGSEITIDAKSSGQEIEISFTDSGCGISPEDQTRIFERFYRVESSRSTPGNGLGLNLAKAFIENHGGKISVNSKINEGSCFKISLQAMT